ncbi:cytochrome c [Rickettsiales bacterium]|nr:cytochrome c [Rickettsiales bacterium]
MQQFILIAIIFFSICNAFAENKPPADDHEPKEIKWPFEGVFGKFDRPAAQRGYQVYREVCSACHSLKYVAFRNLKEIGFAEGEVKSIAASYQVQDGPDDSGDMFERPALPSDYFVLPFANKQAAMASNGGAYPPNLSLIIKAEPDGPNYVYSILTGYQDPPEGFEVPPGSYYNLYHENQLIAMSPPLSEGLVSYQDGTEATVEQMAFDVVNFLAWAAEPKMEQRKKTGLKVIIFLSIMTILFIIIKKDIWRDLFHSTADQEDEIKR